ncbi:MAG: DUF3558 domain-containing protein [Actinomycetota bacterium]|nr:DUF3558 domain-containing protein [Actinomycetota bacterium]
MRTRLLTSVITAACVISLAGCGTGSSPEQTPPSPTQAASPIPPVKNPRDVAAMSRRTCELLTSQQGKSFGLDLPPRQSDGLFGTLRCEWTSTTSDRRTARRVAISVFTNNPTLEVAYSKRQGLPFFELTQVAGYPAIVARPNADLPVCDIDVKTAERQSVTVIYESKEFDSNPQQSCEVGKQVAAAVVMNLPPKS